VRGSGVGAVDLRLPDGAKGVHPRAHLGGDQGMTRPRWMRSRWVVVPLVMAVMLLAWNGYVALNDGGVVEGRVVDGSGRPVPDATAALLERNFIMHNERQRTTTDAAGRR